MCRTRLRYVRCSVLQCVAVCCSVLQCVAVCCSAINACRIYVSHKTQICQSNVSVGLSRLHTDVSGTDVLSTVWRICGSVKTLYWRIWDGRMYLTDISETDVSVWRICGSHKTQLRHEFKSDKNLSWHHMWVSPHEKLPGDGVSTPMPLFCLICTIISNKTCILD